MLRAYHYFMVYEHKRVLNYQKRNYYLEVIKKKATTNTTEKNKWHVTDNIFQIIRFKFSSKSKTILKDNINAFFLNIV